MQQCTHCPIAPLSFGGFGACEQNRLQTSTTELNALPVCLPSPLPPQDTFPARPGLLWISQCGLQEGLSLLRLKRHGETGTKPSPLQNLAVFPKERLSLFFFPFQDTCQGSISGKWKDRAVFLGLWSGMITDRKDKCTFSGARATVKVTEKVEAFSH